jgi:hypothetical protein
MVRINSGHMIMAEKKKPEKQKPFRRIDLQTLRDFIVALDGYRVHSYTDIESMDKAVSEGKLGNKIAEDWEENRKILIKMASSTAAIPGVLRFLKVRDAISLVSMILMSTVFVLLILQVLLRQSIAGVYIDFIYISAFLFLIISIVSRFLINREVSLKIEKYHAENPEKLRAQIQRLKEITQDLLNTLCRNIKLSGKKPDDYVMKLYNIDYQGIRVLQGPGRWRKYYVVVPKTRSEN